MFPLQLERSVCCLHGVRRRSSREQCLAKPTGILMCECCYCAIIVVHGWRTCLLGMFRGVRLVEHVRFILISCRVGRHGGLYVGWLWRVTANHWWQCARPWLLLMPSAPASLPVYCHKLFSLFTAINTAGGHVGWLIGWDWKAWLAELHHMFCDSCNGGPYTHMLLYMACMAVLFSWC